MSILKPALIIAVFVCGMCAGVSSAADVKGGKDHPLIKRYEGSSLLWYEQKNYDALKMALECIVFDYNEGKMKPFKKVEVEGRKTTLFYNLPAGIGTLEGVRQYENELKEKGFEILFRASGEEVEKNKGDNLAMEVYGMTSENTNRDHPQIMAIKNFGICVMQTFAPLSTKSPVSPVKISLSIPAFKVKYPLFPDRPLAIKSFIKSFYRCYKYRGMQRYPPDRLSKLSRILMLKHPLTVLGIFQKVMKCSLKWYQCTMYLLNN